jgi:hypothetical protein
MKKILFVLVVFISINLLVLSLITLVNTVVPDPGLIDNNTIELDKGAPGVLIYQSDKGQYLRMWQMPHRMEFWLSSQKNLVIENIYSFDHRSKTSPTDVRYYLQYRINGKY